MATSLDPLDAASRSCARFSHRAATGETRRECANANMGYFEENFALYS
jgi:hypothetical protein